MAEYRVRATGQVMFENELRSWAQANGGPSWDQTTDEVLQALEVDPVFEGPQATTTPPYEISVRQGVELLDGKWYTKYVVGPVFTDLPAQGDRPAQTAAQQEAAYKASKDEAQAAVVRAQRAGKLAACDWTQLDDTPLTNAKKLEWATYRQALRDISAQPGFPWNVEWPVAP